MKFKTDSLSASTTHSRTGARWRNVLIVLEQRSQILAGTLSAAALQCQYDEAAKVASSAAFQRLGRVTTTVIIFFVPAMVQKA